MFWFLGVILGLLLFVPIVRIIAILLLCALVFSFYSHWDTKPNVEVLTYEQLRNYPTECSKATEQLKELREIQKIKNFDPDPDNLGGDDYLYNSRLKATIWWYAYTCDKS